MACQCNCCGGACCYDFAGTPTCTFSTCSECEELNGEWQGPGTECIGSSSDECPCDPPADHTACEKCVDGTPTERCAEGKNCCDGVCQAEPCGGECDCSLCDGTIDIEIDGGTMSLSLENTFDSVWPEPCYVENVYTGDAGAFSDWDWSAGRLAFASLECLEDGTFKVSVTHYWYTGYPDGPGCARTRTYDYVFESCGSDGCPSGAPTLVSSSDTGAESDTQVIDACSHPKANFTCQTDVGPPSSITYNPLP